MKTRGAGANFMAWMARLLFLLLTQLCIEGTVRGQNAAPQPADATASTDQSSSPAQGSSVAAPSSQSGEPGASGEQGGPSNIQGYGLHYTNDAPLSGVDTTAVDPFSPHGTGLGFGEGFNPNLGSLHGSLSVGGIGTNFYYAPFLRRAPAPEDANLKIGPIYLDFNSLQADFLYTDNVNLTTKARRSETMAIIALNMTLIAQITDDLQFLVNGSLIYLPLQNQVVLTESSALEGGLGFLLGALPAIAAQASYNALIAGWDVQFVDQFSTGSGHYSDSTRDSFGLFQGSVLQEGGKGNYPFHSGQANIRNAPGTGFDSQNSDFSTYFNDFSAMTSGYLPGDVWVTARASRSDLWYNQGNRGLPTSRDDFYIFAESSRPNMRFTPFVSYDVSHSSDVPGVFQTARAGLFGPVTDQLFLYTDVGYFLSNTGDQGLLWRLNLEHDAGPNTTEYLDVARGLTSFNDEVVTTEYYLIMQALGPTLSAAGFADHSDFQELAVSQLSSRSQEDVGARLTWVLGPLTSMEMSGIYTHQDFSNGYLTNTWTGRLTLRRTISDTLSFQAFYQYQRYTVNQANNGYYENLVFLSLVKYFR